MEEIKLSDIKPNPSNPRTISDEKFKALVKSIKDFPEMLKIRPLVIDDTNTVLGGNMRLKALSALNYVKVPVIRANSLTEAQKKEFIIKDNVGYGEWEWDTLANEWDTDKLEEWGLEIPAFVNQGEAVEDDFDVPVGGSETDIVLGDIFDIGTHRLLCGSSTQTDTWKQLMGEELADLVITDPPYNLDYVGKTKQSLKIQNDKQSDGDFYQFLYDFYTALGSYTKEGGGLVCVARNNRIGKFY